MIRTRIQRRPFLLGWLLAALLLHALLPAGFMPGTAGDLAHGAPLVLCSGGEFKGETGTPGKTSANAGGEDCVFAASTGPALLSSDIALDGHLATVSGIADIALPRPVVAQRAVRPPSRGPPLIS